MSVVLFDTNALYDLTNLSGNQGKKSEMEIILREQNCYLPIPTIIEAILKHENDPKSLDIIASVISEFKQIVSIGYINFTVDDVKDFANNIDRVSVIKKAKDCKALVEADFVKFVQYSLLTAKAIAYAKKNLMYDKINKFLSVVKEYILQGSQFSYELIRNEIETVSASSDSSVINAVKNCYTEGTGMDEVFLSLILYSVKFDINVLSDNNGDAFIKALQYKFSKPTKSDFLIVLFGEIKYSFEQKKPFDESKLFSDYYITIIEKFLINKNARFQLNDIFDSFNIIALEHIEESLLLTNDGSIKKFLSNSKKLFK